MFQLGAWPWAMGGVSGASNESSSDKAAETAKPSQQSLRWLRYGSLVAMAVQNTALAIIMRYSRIAAPKTKQALGKTDDGLYIVTTAVVCSEVVKFIASFFLALNELTCQEVFWSLLGRDAWMMIVPSGLYTLQNNLQYVSMSNLDVSICQVLYQAKLITTAFFSVVMLGRQLTACQWIGICVCAMGVGLVQLSALTEGAASQSASGGNQLVGFVAVMASCMSSGLAGVYTEKVFKNTTGNVWVRNMQLAVFSVAVGCTGALAQDGEEILRRGFFAGYTTIVWAVILTQALGGIVVATVVKYADNIAKGFATGIAIVLTCAISAVLFDFRMTLLYGWGAALVLASLYFYSCGVMPAFGAVRIDPSTELRLAKVGSTFGFARSLTTEKMEEDRIPMALREDSTVEAPNSEPTQQRLPEASHLMSRVVVGKETTTTGAFLP